MRTTIDMHVARPARWVALVAAIAILGTSAFAALAGAQTVSPDTFAPGDTITVDGDDCGPDNADFVNYQVISTLVEVATGVAYGSSQGGVSATGSWSISLTADAVAPAGAYEVRSVCRATSTDSGTSVSTSIPAVAVTVERATGTATMSVTPASGVRPVTAVVTGSSCGPTDAGSRTIRVELLDPSLQQVQMIDVNGTGGDWTATFTIDAARINPYTVRAVCVDDTGNLVLSYPDQRVQVNTPAPVLFVAPAGADPGDVITVVADRCPDPELPRLGGAYTVLFGIEPAGVSFDLQPSGDGAWTARFVVPAGTAPGTYAITAECSFEELLNVSTIFTYPAASYGVQGVSPTATPIPATVVPYPTLEPLPTATPAPTAAPAPTPTVDDQSSGTISFTG